MLGLDHRICVCTLPTEILNDLIKFKSDSIRSEQCTFKFYTNLVITSKFLVMIKWIIKSQKVFLNLKDPLDEYEKKKKFHHHLTEYRWK